MKLPALVRASGPRRGIPVLRILVVGAFLLIGAPQFRQTSLTNPNIGQQFRVTISSNGATRPPLTLQTGVWHHLDVDPPPGGPATSTGCGAEYFEIGEVMEHCERDPDIVLRVMVETSLSGLLNIPAMAPVVRINRAPSAIIERRPAPQARIEIEFDWTDAAAVFPPAKVRFGYETPPGGVIPTKLSGIVGGLLPPKEGPQPGWKPFDPIELELDSGQFTTLTQGSRPPPTYSGPLTIFGGFTQQAQGAEPVKTTDVELTYRPLPERVNFRWKAFDANHRDVYHYTHEPPGLFPHYGDPASCPDLKGKPGCSRDVDLVAQLRSQRGDDPDPARNKRSKVVAKIDRLPSELKIDVTSFTEEDKRSQGVIDFQIPREATGAGGLPDAGVEILTHTPPIRPGDPVKISNVHAELEKIPNHIQARWYIPVEPDRDVPGCEAVPVTDLPSFVSDRCLAQARVEVKEVLGVATKEVGAAEIRVANFEGSPTKFQEFLPERRQYVNLQAAPLGPDTTAMEKLTSARVEGVSVIDYRETADGLIADAQIGDGAQPLQVHVANDARTLLDKDGKPKSKVEADALIAPLPDHVVLTLKEGRKEDKARNVAAEPLVFMWDASKGTPKAIDIDGRVKIQSSHTHVPGDANPLDDHAKLDDHNCGEIYTTCARFDADHVPPKGEIHVVDTDDAKKLNYSAPVAGGDPPPPGVIVPPALRPDLIADVVSRSTEKFAPLLAHFDLDNLPDHLSARMLTPVVKDDKRELEKLEVHPCKMTFTDGRDTPACETVAGTISAVGFHVQNFLDGRPDPFDPKRLLADHRPDNMPSVPVAVTPLYVSAALREAAASKDPNRAPSQLFEVEGRFENVNELQYISHGKVKAAKVRAGDGNKAFTVAFDVLGVKGAEQDATVQDQQGEVVLDPLPADLRICLRGASKKDAFATSAYDPMLTRRCELTAEDTPFKTKLQAPPMAAWLQASADFALTASIRSFDHGKDTDSTPIGINDDKRMQAKVGIGRVPKEANDECTDPKKAPSLRRCGLQVYFEAPDKTDLVRAIFETPPHTAKTSLSFDAKILKADLECGDPRLAPEDLNDGDDSKKTFLGAVCVQGTIQNLPSRTMLLYNPADPKNSFRLENHGGGDVNLRDVLLTYVTAKLEDLNRVETENDPSDDTAVRNVIVVEGKRDANDPVFLDGLPPLVKGVIDAPKSIEFWSADPAAEGSSNFGPPVKRVHAHIRNFIAPDPMVDREPAQRWVDGQQLPLPDQRLIIFKRDKLFKAEVEVLDLSRAGLATAVDAAGKPLDTRVLLVDFGKPEHVIRAYADLVDLKGWDDPKTAADERLPNLSSFIADATLREKPTGVSICFRGRKEVPGTPVVETFCDAEPSDDEGAFQVLGRGIGSDTSTLDVDAFLRASSQLGTKVLAATAAIRNVPPAVQGTFSDTGTVDVGGFKADAVTAKGIDKIGFELANHDLPPEAHGYREPDGKPAHPWGVSLEGLPPFEEKPKEQKNFARLRVLDGLFHVQGGLGVEDKPGEGDSNLTRVFVSSLPCEEPPHKPTDYPFLSTDPDINADYTCLSAKFEQHEKGSVKPLYTDITVDKEGKHLSLQKGGITRIPRFVQVGLAEANTQNADTTFRPPCGLASAASHPDNCLPPLFRVDMDHGLDKDPALFGDFQSGTPKDLEEARRKEIGVGVANGGLAASPGETGWTDWKDGNGIRARVFGFKEKVATGGGDPNKPEERDQDRTAVLAGFHLPIPRTLTLDQFQSWDEQPAESERPGKSDWDPAENKDFRFRYVARDSAYNVVPGLGQLAAMFQTIDKTKKNANGNQLFITGADDEKTPEVIEAVSAGVPLPGELGISLYSREKLDKVVDDKQYNRTFLQLDGRTSSAVPMGVHIAAGNEEESVKSFRADLIEFPAYAPGDNDPLNPSFRLRTEIMNNASVKDDEGCKALFLFCMFQKIRIDSLGTSLNFNGAKRLETVVHIDSTQIGVEMKGFNALDGGEAVPIHVHNFAKIDPMRMFVHVGVPVLAGFTAALSADIKAIIDIHGATDFQFRNNLLRMKAKHFGPGIPDGDDDTRGAEIKPTVDMEGLFALTSVIIPPILTLIYGLAWVWPPHQVVGPEAAVLWAPCSFDGGLGIGRIDMDAGGTKGESIDAVGIPADIRLVEFGTTLVGSVVTDLLGKLIGVPAKAPAVPAGSNSFVRQPPTMMAALSYLFGCVFLDADLELMDGPGKHPSLPSTSVTHPVPGMPGVAAGVPAPKPAVKLPPNLEVETGKTAELCGHHVFTDVNVRKGATLKVATASGANCPAGSEGKLSIAAKSFAVRAGGVFDARPTGHPVSVLADNIVVSGGVLFGFGKVYAGSGLLTLEALRKLDIRGDVIAGELHASTVPGATAASGNSGGGHGASGGSGSMPAGGSAYGNTGFNTDAKGKLETEPGSVGAGPGTPGKGGGTVYLSAPTVDVSGLVAADGGAGSADTSNNCQQDDDPDTKDKDEFTENDGKPGSGGGSGGGIVAVATVIDISGELSANGGAGGKGRGGGGGGGAGGSIKLVAPLITGNEPDVRGGGPGGNDGCTEKSPGNGGGTGRVLRQNDPASGAGIPGLTTDGSGDSVHDPNVLGPEMWFRGADPDPKYRLGVPFRAAAQRNASDDFQVVLCGLHRPPQAVEKKASDGKTPEENFGIDMPEGVSVLSPCGKVPDGKDTTVHQIGKKTVTNKEQSEPDATIPVEGPLGIRLLDRPEDNGYWGLFTILFKPNAEGEENDCLDHSSSKEEQEDVNGCKVEALPAGAKPDVVIGIDNSPPTLDDLGGTQTVINPIGTSEVQIPISGVTDDMPKHGEAGAMKDTSGVKQIVCANGFDDNTSDDIDDDSLDKAPKADTFVGCGTGFVEWTLRPGSGQRVVFVRAIDNAGNITEKKKVFKVDISPPTSTARAETEPDRLDGWYSSSPKFRIEGFGDGTAGSGPGNPPFEFWFDGGAHRTCALIVTPPLCVVEAGLPGPGHHTFNWQAIDAAGNRQPPQKLKFKVDGNAPKSEQITAPFRPDGANGWFVTAPWVYVNALDAPGESGVADVFVGIDGAAPTPQRRQPCLTADTVLCEIVQLASRDHTITFYAVDKAGNKGAEQTVKVKVDLEDPVATLSPDPASPNGASGWYKSKPSMAVAVNDGAGSGIGAVTGAVCGPQPPSFGAAGSCLSLDGKSFKKSDPSELLKEGTTEARAFAVDIAGRRGALARRTYRVDISAPMPHIRTVAPAPAQAGRYRRAPVTSWGGKPLTGAEGTCSWISIRACGTLAVISPHDEKQSSPGQKHDNSGIDRVEYGIDKGALTRYGGPVDLPEGIHTLEVKTVDVAGNSSVKEVTFHVDVTPPVVTATSPDPSDNPWTRAPNNPTASLRWTAFDAPSQKARVSLLIYGGSPAVGTKLLRRIEVSPGEDAAGLFSNYVNPNPLYNGTTEWDGKIENVGGLEDAPARLGANVSNCVLGVCTGTKPTPWSGRYWWRVVVSDEAGNQSESGDSAYIEVTR